MESVYTQVPNLGETIDLVDNQVESNSERYRSSPHPQESSRLLSEVDQLPLRPPPRSYIPSPLCSTAFSFTNTFEPDSSPSGLSSKGHNEASGAPRVLLRLPDENGVLSRREKRNVQFASTSTRDSSTSSSGGSLLFPCDHSRYPLEKSRKLEGFVAYDYDLYEDKEPDPDEWLYDPDSSFPSKSFALSRRGIANIGFLAVLIIIIFFVFVGLPIYTTTVRGWDVLYRSIRDFAARYQDVETSLISFRDANFPSARRGPVRWPVLSHEILLQPLILLDFHGPLKTRTYLPITSLQ
ncbi:hypothetical protein JOM56_011140 [Amanita muscaria]